MVLTGLYGEGGLERKLLSGIQDRNLLPFRQSYEEGREACCYDITALQPLERVLPRRRLLQEDIRFLLLQLDHALSVLEEHMLTERCLLLSPEHIYVDAEQLTASLNATSKDLHSLISKDIPQLTSNVNVITENLKGISENLKGVDYASTFVKIDSTLQNVRMITDKLNRKDNSLGLLLNDESFYNNLNATANNAASLLKDLQEHPKRYVHFSLFGRKDK